ncbi:MAG: hypothetical protein Q4P28_06225 [Tissierellia bacterium]|nr:hypothetical protein [Tissierellia bacterium]
MEGTKVYKTLLENKNNEKTFDCHIMTLEMLQKSSIRRIREESL